ncbi:hypothetical protein [Niallia sp. 03190]|uniref:hypothetical protein n=1 Tax=Niallia sp. 03190 TaxID=3458061 RepID=UPI004044AC3B
MKDFSYCLCGSGKAKEDCCERTPQTKIMLHPIENSQERQKFLKKIQISSHFNMRFRALFEFYGDDLIEYKQDHFSDDHRNEFLRIFSSYMTDYLEDKIPSSWKKCKTPFWEKLIFLYFPLSIKITPEKKEAEAFMSELQKFSQWLDHRANTGFCKVIGKYTEAFNDLKACEQLLNHLFLSTFPNIHQKDWDYNRDLEKLEEEFSEFKDTNDSLFEVTRIFSDTIVLTDIHSKRIYNIQGLPLDLVIPGMILHGVIGKKANNLFWKWHHTDGVYPQKAKRYFSFVS